MAEQVQKELDQMVAPLLDLWQRGFLTQTEIHAVVNRRRNSEYTLQKRRRGGNGGGGCQPADYLQYIQDEIQLARLLSLRWKRKQRENPHDAAAAAAAAAYASSSSSNHNNDTNNSSNKQSLASADKHVVQHIHFLWKRCLRKFRSHQELYRQYADFLKQQQKQQSSQQQQQQQPSRLLSQLYTTCLQLFPQEPAWWMEAASHEYKHMNVDHSHKSDNNNHNSPNTKTTTTSTGSSTSSSLPNARILLQRGLRIHSGCMEMWLHAFGLELQHAVAIQKQQQQWSLLGLNKRTTTTGRKDDNSNNNKDDTTNSSDDPFKLARLVYDNAVQALGSNKKSSHSNTETTTTASGTNVFGCHCWDLCQRQLQQQQHQQLAGRSAAIVALQEYILESILHQQQQQQQNENDAVGAWIAVAKCRMMMMMMPTTTTTKTTIEKKNQQIMTGGLLLALNDDSSVAAQEKEEAINHEGPPQKKRRGTTTTTRDDVDNKNNNKEITATCCLEQDQVLVLMRKATQTIPTAEMYLQAIRLLLFYRDSMMIHKDDSTTTAKDNTDDGEEANDDNAPIVIKACSKLVEKLFQEAAHLKDYSEPLLLEHVNYLLEKGKLQAAISRLERFATTTTATRHESASAAVWMQWASLVWEQHNPSSKKSKRKQQQQERAIRILRQGLERTSMSEPDYMVLLLQQLGAYLALKKDNKTLQEQQQAIWAIFERVLLLAPGYKGQQPKNIQEPVFGVQSVADACLQYLSQTVSRNDRAAVRKIYEAVLFRSSLTDSITSEDDALCYRAFIDACIEFEKDQASHNKAVKDDRLLRLFNIAIKIFKGTSHGEEYRERRDNEVIYG